MVYLRDLFSTPDASGSQLAGRYVVPLEDPDLIAASSAVLAQDPLAAI